MTKVFEGREFHSYSDRNSRRTFSDLEFRKCHFVGCAVSITRNPRLRSTIRNVKITDCGQLGCALYPAIIEDVLVDGFKTNGQLFQTWGAVFNHVTIRGKIGQLMTSPLIATARGTPEQQKSFSEVNTLYYENLDWALDIREAEFQEADLRGIPAHLVLRDPDTQFVISREKALEGKWKEIDLSGTYWKVSIEFFLRTGFESEILVAPKRNPRFRPLLEGLWALRDAGVIF